MDAARQEFLRKYVEVSKTMVDYLHLEIARSFAAGETGLLGPEYPGPLV